MSNVQTKCWLRFTGEPATGNAYSEWAQGQNESYRDAAIERFRSEGPQDEYAVAPAQEDLQTSKWRLGFDVVGTFQNLETRLHAVERVPPEGRGKSARFLAIRFVFTNKLGKDEKLLLAFDALVLTGILGREVSLGKIIHGDHQAAQKVKTVALAGEVRKRIKKIAALLSSQSPPDLILNRHCTECEFQARCRQKAMEKDDLSLLAGMNEKDRKKHHSKGIFTITQLSCTFRPRRRPRRLRDKREKYHHSLKALAIRERKIHIIGSPELKIEGTPVYLDVEGLPDRDFYYLIGMRIGTHKRRVQMSRRVEKEVRWEVSHFCPVCKRRVWKKGPLRTRTLQDILFGRNSLKLRIVRFVFQTYHCPKCRNCFGMPARFQLCRKYGWNFLAYFFSHC